MNIMNYDEMVYTVCLGKQSVGDEGHYLNKGEWEQKGIH